MKIIWCFLRPYKFYFVFLLVVGIAIGILETLHVAVLYPILNGALDTPSGQGGNFFLSAVGYLVKLIPIDDVVVANSIMFIILTVLFFILRMVYLIFSLRVTSRIVTGNMQKVFQKYITSDYQFFVDNKQGELLFKAVSAPTAIATLLEPLTNFIAEGIMSISVFVLLFTLSWPGAIMATAVGAAYFYLARYLSRRVSYIAGMRRREASQRETVVLTEYITGIKPIKIFETSPYWKTQFSSAVNKFWGYWIRSNFWLQTPANLINLALFSLVALAVIVMKIQNPADFVSIIPVFGTFAFAIFKLLPRLANFGTYQMRIMDSLPNVEAVREVLQDTTYNKISNGSQNFSRLESGIEFRNVKFIHKKRESTLDDISFKIERDKTTAIVGASGAGKSTIVDLLLRLYDVNSGGIYIDNTDLREYNIYSFLTKVGFVGQETFIHNASVKDNISFGQSYTMAEIIEAAQRANAHEFIQQLPEGYDTPVGDRGVRLSGGEKQRIAIARAMVRKPEILVLDEATSSLDNISQKAVQEALDKVSKNCTTLVIAHRLSTIRNADMIYVLDNGTIVESGTHDQLMKQKGKYWNSYHSQEE